ncbi:MAG: helix-turn-helix domain-containing protein [Phenylobacterium sp.]|uniref:helix-turn-helix domain-containing protein n=1 Tax=Phenylobacterium sp. TaxID=1871053 RepID=UPI003919C36F
MRPGARPIPPTASSQGGQDEPCATAISEAFARHGARLLCRRRTTIYSEGGCANRAFYILRGVVRTSRVSATGRREVGDFYEPGGVYGLESSAERRFAAEAVTDCEFLVVLRQEIRADPQLQQAIDAATRLELARMQDHLSLLRRMSAREKVASFLTRLSGPHAASPVALPMGRQDVADFLGLTMETVSRVLSQFERDGVLRFAGPRQFEVHRPQVLAALAA